MCNNKNIIANNKAVFITGCDSGFGYDLVKRLDSLGYKVFAGCLRPKSTGPLSLTQFCSSRVDIVPLDVTSDESVLEARAHVENNLGDKVLWALVNNAGIMHVGEMEWAAMEDIREDFEVNAFGIIRVTKVFLSLIKAAKGRIINNTSIGGRYIYPGFVGYCMSKSSAITFTEGLKMEMLQWNVKVIDIQAYFYETPLISEQNVKKRIDDSIRKADPVIRQVNGENYFETFKSRCKKITADSSSIITEVINCLEEAITSKEPESVYFLVPLHVKIKIILLRILPLIFGDTITNGDLDMKMDSRDHELNTNMNSRDIP